MKEIIIAKGLRTIKIDATEQDLIQRGQACAEMSQKIGAIELEKKDCNASFKTSIDSLKAQIDSLSTEIIDKKITVHKANCIEIIYPDTETYKCFWGEKLVEEREMTAEEKEKFLSGVFANPKNADFVQENYNCDNDIKEVIKLESRTKTKSNHI